MPNYSKNEIVEHLYAIHIYIQIQPLYRAQKLAKHKSTSTCVLILIADEKKISDI